MCTAVTYKTKDHYFGRNLDYDHSFGEEVVLTPQEHLFVFPEGKVMRKHHAILGTALVQEGYPLYFDAMNEKGLGMAGLNFVGNAYFIWQIMFSGDSLGYINNFLISFGLITEPIQWFKDVNYNMVYVIAAYHDIGHHIDRKNHEKVSADIMCQDKNLNDSDNNKEDENNTSVYTTRVERLFDVFNFGYIKTAGDNGDYYSGRLAFELAVKGAVQKAYMKLYQSLVELFAGRTVTYPDYQA